MVVQLGRDRVGIGCWYDEVTVVCILEVAVDVGERYEVREIYVEKGRAEDGALYDAGCDWFGSGYDIEEASGVGSVGKIIDYPVIEKVWNGKLGDFGTEGVM